MVTGHFYFFNMLDNMSYMRYTGNDNRRCAFSGPGITTYFHIACMGWAADEDRATLDTVAPEPDTVEMHF